MPEVIDVFAANGFDMATLSRAISNMPILYGRLAQPFIINGQAYELFPYEGIATRDVSLDLYEGKLHLLDFQPVGSPSQFGERDGEKMLSFRIPFIPLDDIVLPGEVQGVRELGTNQLRTLQSLALRKLRGMRNKHDITHEFLRAGAITGKIYRPNGVLLYDLFAQFGVTQKVIAFALGTATTEVLDKAMQVSRHIEANMGGDTIAGIVGLCGATFFTKLITHPKVKDEYQRWNQGNFPGKDYRRRFEYGGLVFEEYVGKATDNRGNERVFVGDAECQFFPVGSADTFRQYGAPGDFIETANTIGERVYAKTAPMEMNRGIKMHTQSSPLPLCMRPQALVKATTN
jgi:hypothetical protein